MDFELMRAEIVCTGASYPSRSHAQHQSHGRPPAWSRPSYYAHQKVPAGLALNLWRKVPPGGMGRCETAVTPSAHAAPASCIPCQCTEVPDREGEAGITSWVGSTLRGIRCPRKFVIRVDWPDNFRGYPDSLSHACDSNLPLTDVCVGVDVDADFVS